MHRASNISGFSLAHEMLREGKSVKMNVLGQSMIPFLRSGQCITIRPTLPNDIRRGVIVLAQVSKQKYVVHRVYKIDSEQITLLGDGNVNPEYVRREQICGTVDSSPFEQRLARLWQWMRPLRRYPLAVLRRIMPK